MARYPLLQVIHMSDLHVGDGYDDKAGIAKVERLVRTRLRIRELLEDRNLQGWREGTLTSDVTAIEAFEDFLSGLRKQDSDWFGKSEATDVPRTWLLDTGDLTTFGDKGSLDLARTRLERWIGLLAPCEARILYGNHDAWPGTQPGLLSGREYLLLVEQQQNTIAEWKALRQETWAKPLVVEHQQANVRIELYGLNTVVFDSFGNARAIGRVRLDELSGLVKVIGFRSSRTKLRTYRMLATHHPLAFPYKSSETSAVFGLIATNALQDAKQIAKVLNEQASAYGSPSIHMFLSGHSHATHPGGPLGRTVAEFYQSGIGPRQLQLVVGPLMLVCALAATEAAKPSEKRVKDFSDDSKFESTRQFQILRFYSDDKQPLGLVLERTIVAYDSGAGYKPIPEKHSETVALF